MSSGPTCDNNWIFRKRKIEINQEHYINLLPKVDFLTDDQKKSILAMIKHSSSVSATHQSIYHVGNFDYSQTHQTSSEDNACFFHATSGVLDESAKIFRVDNCSQTRATKVAQFKSFFEGEQLIDLEDIKNDPDKKIVLDYFHELIVEKYQLVRDHDSSMLQHSSNSSPSNQKPSHMSDTMYDFVYPKLREKDKYNQQLSEEKDQLSSSVALDILFTEDLKTNLDLNFYLTIQQKQFERKRR